MAVEVGSSIVEAVGVFLCEVVVGCRNARMAGESCFLTVEILVVFFVRLKFMSHKTQEGLLRVAPISHVSCGVVCEVVVHKVIGARKSVRGYFCITWFVLVLYVCEVDIRRMEIERCSSLHVKSLREVRKVHHS